MVVDGRKNENNCGSGEPTAAHKAPTSGRWLVAKAEITGYNLRRIQQACGCEVDVTEGGYEVHAEEVADNCSGSRVASFGRRWLPVVRRLLFDWPHKFSKADFEFLFLFIFLIFNRF